MVPPLSGSQPRCGNPACGRPIERQATGRPARYCSGTCRQAARRDRLRLAGAGRQRAERLGADPAVPDQYRDATQAAVFRARDRAPYQASPMPREIAGTRAGRQGSPDGEACHPVYMPIIRDAVDTPGAPPGLGTQAPRAWPPWAWTVA